jgi:geranylgeranyl diphosphate synthase type II
MKDNSARMNETESFLAEAAELVNAELDWLIPEQGRGPQNLRDAMRWSLFAGGKRFRPALVLAVGRNFGKSDSSLVRTGAAIEMIHTYSLIHDDLPSMDNDDLRRGRETCHKKYGEATAILAGDALQALAFQSIAEDGALNEKVKIELITGLGKAAASMVVGQQMDLESEGLPISSTDLERIHRNKTGALIEFSAVAGAIISGCSDNDRAAITEYGKKIGLLFQIVDDLLDVTETTESLGKTAGKDALSEKATYPSVFGLDETRELAAKVHYGAIDALSSATVASQLLKMFPDYLLNRRH